MKCEDVSLKLTKFVNSRDSLNGLLEKQHPANHRGGLGFNSKVGNPPTTTSLGANMHAYQAPKKNHYAFLYNHNTTHKKHMKCVKCNENGHYANKCPKGKLHTRTPMWVIFYAKRQATHIEHARTHVTHMHAIPTPLAKAQPLPRRSMGLWIPTNVGVQVRDAYIEDLVRNVITSCDYVRRITPHGFSFLTLSPHTRLLVGFLLI